MINTVDVVIVGADAAAIAATIDAVQRGLRVLVVIRTRQAGLARRFRKSVAAAVTLPRQQLTVITGAEVACVDGVNRIEAIVVRRRRTGRLIGFNAAALVAGTLMALSIEKVAYAADAVAATILNVGLLLLAVV